MVVVDTDVPFEILSTGVYDIHIYSPEEFQLKLDSHKFDVITAYFAPIIEKKKMVFTLDKSKLKNSVIQKADQSYIKARKHTLRKEYTEAKKSLYHSFRILNFGLQIAVTKKIYDFQACKEIRINILALSEGRSIWDKWDSVYKQILHAEKRRYNVAILMDENELQKLN